MKLRTRRGAIRLRLTQGEVATLAAEGRVTETIVIGPREDDVLRYALVASEAATTTGARMDGRDMIVEVPAARAKAWATGGEVGLEATQAVGAATLAILIEKDFACLAPRAAEEDVDTFPNPRAPRG